MTPAPDLDRDHASPRGPRVLGLACTVALVLLAALSAHALSRGGAALDDGPRVTGVSVRAIARTFIDEDRGGPALTLDREVTIEGRGFTGTSHGPFVHFITAEGARVEAVMVVLESGGRLLAFPPPGLRGALRLEVENPDSRTARATVGL